MPYLKRARWLWLVLLLLLGFWLRFTFLIGNIYYGDEFISMLAAKMVAEHGWPILPSGLFYDHGLLYSLTAGAFVAALGFSEQVARWPVLLVSVVTIALYYNVARRLFDSHLTGLIAATLITFDTLAMKWGVWARMYALAHMFVLLTVGWLLLSTLKRPSPGGRYLLLVFLAGMLFSHSLTFVLLPPLGLLLLIFTFANRPAWLTQRQVWLQGVLGVGLVGLALWVVAQGQVGSTVSLQDRGEAVLTLPAGLGFLQGFFLITFDSSHYTALLAYFQTPAYGWFFYLIGLTALVVLYRLGQRRATFADVAFLFLLFLVILVIFEMGTLLTGEWRQSRYLFFLGLPVFLLLGAESLSRLLRGLVALLPLKKKNARGLPRLEAALPLLIVIPIAVLWGGPTWDLAAARSTGDYDTAYDYVRKNWQPGDRIMSEHPAAAYLYMGQIDYYANQTSAKVLADEEEFAPIDRYGGSPLIDTVEALNAALATGQRIWLVVGDKHLNRYYGSFFRQQIFAQMDLVYQAGSKYVLLSQAHPVPLPAEPQVVLAGNFDNRLLLGGYSLDLSTIAPDGTVSLGLYWRPIGQAPATPKKIFVQLRNSQNQIVAQADHFIYEGLFYSSDWNELQAEQTWLRDSAALQLPLPLSPEQGSYRLFVGFYDPQTFERLPVIDDQSGENAVIIDLSALFNPT